MNLITSQDYKFFERFAYACKCGNVYPLSIVQSYQEGSVFTKQTANCNTVLFWHYSGFAFVSGRYDEDFLEMICKMLSEANKNNRRFILFNTDERIDEFFVHKRNSIPQRRYFYEYNMCREPVIQPHSFELKPIDTDNIARIQGKITPAFSWENEDAFLSKGKGYCIEMNGDIAAWAFSAAISDKEIDIGVETNEKYSGMGLASMVCKEMIKYILNENKKPVWACHSQNIASAKLATKIGFQKISECSIINI